MGTITTRRRKDGTLAYTAQIRIMRDGKAAHTESQTFDRKGMATNWLHRREHDLAAPGALAQMNRADPVLSEIITRYLLEYEAIRPLGKTKRQCLTAMARTWLGELPASAITSEQIVEYARRRLVEGHIQPQTVTNDLSHLGAIFSIAKPAWGYPLDDSAMRQARAVTKKMGLTCKSRERSRRPTLEELDRLMTHFGKVRARRRDSIPMQAIIPFAIFSSRRQEEILRIRWEHLDQAESTIMVKDMKAPGTKWGNDVVCVLPARALALIQSRARTSDRIFPFSTDAVGAAFTRACQLLGIIDLHFHDLRREAVSHCFELGMDIPYVAQISAHADFNMLRRYTNLKGKGDKYAEWKWMDVALMCG